MRRRDFILTLARDAMIERLEPILVDANVVVDLGSGNRSTRRALKRRFRGARIVPMDGDAAIRLEDGSVDVVFANLVLPRIGDPAALFADVARVLRLGGLFAFSTLGPDTLPDLLDLHDVGDAALRAGLRDPVLDVDRTSLNYESADLRRRDLAELGLSDTIAAEKSSLELELVYGHCWGPGPRPDDGDIIIEPARITRR
jgi:malonyl-CoA O-methyltransferase